jgi:ATP-binding cassette subfamily B protein
VKISELLRRLLHYLSPHWRHAILVLTGLLLEMCFSSLLPFSFKFIVDDGVLGQNRRLLAMIIAGLATGAIAVSLIGLGRDYLFSRITASVLAEIRIRMFRHLQRLSMDFYAHARSGDILSRFSGDLATVETALVNALPWGALPLLHVIANTVLLFVLDFYLAMVAMLVWPMCLVGPRVFTPRAVDASYRRKQDEGRTITDVQEQIALQPIVKALDLHALSLTEFRARNAKLSRSVLRAALLSAWTERSAWIGIMLVQVAILGMGAWMASRGSLSVGTLAAFLALYLDLALSLSYTAQYVPTLVQAAAGMQRIEGLLAEEVQVADAPDATPIAPLSREIRLRDVVFGYTVDDVHLHGVSLSIAAGQSVAFVGASGSGKSTVLNLLMRFYDPRSGSICIDGRDLRTTTQSSLRQQMSVVFQESFLFSAAVRENIRMGKLDATQAEIEQAARDAEIHDYIMSLPQRYETVLGERGVGLSVGQRQRLAIARAIVRDPRILVLDEATSALDPGTESAVNETLERVARGRTMISVTHRLASAAGADRIFVLKSGNLVESGRHAELIELGGHYAGLWAKQSGLSINAKGDHASISLERLRALPVLDQLDDALLTDVARLFVTEQHPQGRMVVYEGDRGDRFYIIARGSVEILRAADDTGEQQRIGVCEDGDYFGEIALIKNVSRTASVRTLTPCTFLSLQREQFLYLLERAPQLRARLERVLTERLGVDTTMPHLAMDAAPGPLTWRGN